MRFQAVWIIDLKQQDGRDIAVHGSATLVQTLMQHDLVDNYRLLVYPVVLGKGKRLAGRARPACPTKPEICPLEYLGDDLLVVAAALNGYVMSQIS